MNRVLALATLLAVSCGSDGPGIRGEPIRIGVIVSQTGPLAPVGEHLANSAILAAREINAAGGLLGGRPVELIIKDDQTDAIQAAAVTTELLQEDQVVAVVGPLGSEASAAAQEVTFAAQVPQVSCCSTSQELTGLQPESDRYLFRTVPSDLLQTIVVTRYAREIGCTRLAVLHQADTYGDPFGEGIEERFSAAGGEVVLRQPFPLGRPSYSTEVNAIADANPDCIALVAFPVDGGTILSEWAALSSPPDVTWIASDGLKDPGFVTAAGSASAVDGVLGTAPITEPETRFFNTYAADFEATFGSEVGIFGGNQFDAMASLLLAIEAAGSTDGTAIRDALFRVTNPDAAAPREDVVGPGDLATALRSIRAGNEIDYEGASGPINIDSFGNTLSNYEIWRYEEATDDFLREDVIQASEIQ
ncbi:MAG: ABC transporter substrate-binding protein [Myxococcota bacterium]